MIGFHRLQGYLHRYCCLWDCPSHMTIVFASSWCYQDKATGIGPTFTVHRQTSFFFHVPYLYSTKTTNATQNMMEIATVEPPKVMNWSNRPFLPVKHPRPKKHPSMPHPLIAFCCWPFGERWLVRSLTVFVMGRRWTSGKKKTRRRRRDKKWMRFIPVFHVVKS